MARRKRKIKMPPQVIKVVGIIIVVSLIGALAYSAIGHFFKSSNFFRVKNVDVDPSIGFIRDRDISTIKGKNIFQIDLKKLRKKLHYRYPQVSQLKIIKRFPDQILIKVKERYPFAQTRFDNKILTLDKKAIILSTVSKRDKKLPFIIGIDNKKVTVHLGQPLKKKGVKTAIGIVEVFKANNFLSAYSISKIDISNLSKIELLLKGDLKVIMDRDNVSKKIDNLGVVLSQGKFKVSDIKYIDLRFKEPIIGKK